MLEGGSRIPEYSNHMRGIIEGKAETGEPALLSLVGAEITEEEDSHRVILSLGAGDKKETYLIDFFTDNLTPEKGSPIRVADAKQDIYYHVWAKKKIDADLIKSGKKSPTGETLWIAQIKSKPIVDVNKPLDSSRSIDDIRNFGKE